jgi:hypothetical protein
MNRLHETYVAQQLPDGRITKLIALDVDDEPIQPIV